MAHRRSSPGQTRNARLVKTVVSPMHAAVSDGGWRMHSTRAMTHPPALPHSSSVNATGSVNLVCPSRRRRRAARCSTGNGRKVDLRVGVLRMTRSGSRT